MKFSTIEKKIRALVEKPTGHRVRQVAGVEVQTVFYPASKSTGIFVLGEKFESIYTAAQVVYEFQK